MQKDIIFDLIKREKQRQICGLELIASENYVSDNVEKSMGTCLTNKYAEGLPGKRYYGGCEVVDEVETECISRLKKLYNATWVNVQPHSGASANTAIFLATLNPGDTILGLDLAHGGHLTHGMKINISGKYFNAIGYPVKKETGKIDYNQVEKIANDSKPKLLICGGSAYSSDWDYKKFKEIAKKVGAVLWCDMAHPAGLIATKLLNDPLEYCDVVTSTTHKTLRGPRGGIILLRNDIDNPLGMKNLKGNFRSYSSVLDSAVFPGLQGGPLMHVIASKAVSFGEALDPSFTTYSKQIIKNAKAMVNSFVEKGYNVISGGTENHLMLIDLRNKNITGKECEEALGKADITINKNMVPFDDKPSTIASGIRIGTAAITTRGLNEENVKKVVELIDTVIINKNNEKKILEVKKEVNEWMINFKTFAW